MRLSIHLKSLLTLIVAIFVFSVVVPFVSAPIPGAALWLVRHHDVVCDLSVRVVQRGVVGGVHLSGTQPSAGAYSPDEASAHCGVHRRAAPVRLVFFDVGGRWRDAAGRFAGHPSDTAVVGQFPGKTTGVAGHFRQPHSGGRSASRRARRAGVASSITKIASSATGTPCKARGTSPRGSTRRRRIFRPAARSRSCPSRICSGVSPRAGRDCRASRRRGIRPCRSGRTF